LVSPRRSNKGAKKKQPLFCRETGILFHPIEKPVWQSILEQQFSNLFQNTHHT
jgi:hypothetical protein